MKLAKGRRAEISAEIKGGSGSGSAEAEPEDDE
jgi:hypothetical protein